MINMQEAEGLARVTIKRFTRRNENDLVLLTKHTVEHADGWVFFYNSLEFIQTGNPMYMLAGNGPIFVSSSGKQTILPSGIPWEEAILKLNDYL